MKQKKDSKTEQAIDNEVHEPELPYNQKHKFRFFNSFEEQEEAELLEAINRTPFERMMLLRQSINIAYNFDPEKTPKKRSIVIDWYDGEIKEKIN